MSDEKKPTVLRWAPLIPAHVDAERHPLQSLMVCPRCGALVPKALKDRHDSAHLFSPFAGF